MKIKFLIIRLSSIGDIVLTTPVIRCLKQQVEGAEIHFVVKEKHANIISANPYIDKIHLLTENISELLSHLEGEGFDYIIDLHQNFRSNRIKHRLNIPAFSFNKLNLQKWLLVNLKIDRLPNLHIVDRYMETVRLFDVANDGKGLDYFIPEDEEYDFSKLPAVFKNGYIAFVIAGTYPTKKLPKEKVVEICNQSLKPVILLGGRHEVEEALFITEQTGSNVISLCGKTSLNQSADVVNHARIVLSNDTGLMHIAAAFHKKILSFWGNTIPGFGMYPYLPAPGSDIIQVENLKCRPCSKLGFSKCPKKHFNCMQGINTTEVAQWINSNF